MKNGKRSVSMYVPDKNAEALLAAAGKMYAEWKARAGSINFDSFIIGFLARSPIWTSLFDLEGELRLEAKMRIENFCSKHNLNPRWIIRKFEDAKLDPSAKWRCGSIG